MALRAAFEPKLIADKMRATARQMTNCVVILVVVRNGRIDAQNLRHLQECPILDAHDRSRPRKEIRDRD